MYWIVWGFFSLKIDQTLPSKTVVTVIGVGTYFAPAATVSLKAKKNSVCSSLPHLHGSCTWQLHPINVNGFHLVPFVVASDPAQLIHAQQRLFIPVESRWKSCNCNGRVLLPKKSIQLSPLSAGLLNFFCAHCLTRAAKTGRWMPWTLSMRRTWWMMLGDFFSWRRPQATLATPSVNLEQVEKLCCWCSLKLLCILS